MVQPVSRPAERARPELRLTDPRPLPEAGSFLRKLAQFAVIGIFIVMLGVVLDLARALVLPVAAAAVVGTMLSPLGGLAERARVPPWLFATATVLLFLFILQVLTAAVSAPLVDWIGRAPELVEAIRIKLQGLEEHFAAIRAAHSLMESLGATGGMRVDVAAIVQPLVGFLSPAIGEIAIFLATLFFVLADRVDLRKHLILIFGDKEDRLRAIRILNDIEHHLALYIGTVTVINMCVGLITAAGAWLLGFDQPALIGALAFVCNYVPYVGPALVIVVLFVVGLISFPSLAYAGLAPLLYLGLTFTEGHVVTPSILGRRMTLSPLAVFLNLAFWTWLWGPVGAFLSVPFLIFGLVIFNHLVAEDAELPA